MLLLVRGGAATAARAAPCALRRCAVRAFATGLPRPEALPGALRALARDGRPDEAVALYEAAAAAGELPAVPDVFHAAITVYGRTQQAGAAFGVLETMRAAGVEPTTRTMSSLVTAATRARALELVERVQALVRESDGAIRPDHVFFNSLIASARATGNVDAALQHMRDMQQAGVAPDVVTFNAFIGVCGNARRLRPAVAALLEMRHLGIAPDARTFTALLDVAAKCNHVPFATQVLDELEGTGLRLEGHTVMQLCYAAARVRSAELAERAAAHHAKLPAASADDRVAAAAVNMWTAIGEPGRALEAFGAHRERAGGRVPSMALLSAAAAAVADAGTGAEHAESLLELAVTVDAPMPSELPETLVRGCVGGGGGGGAVAAASRPVPDAAIGAALRVLARLHELGVAVRHRAAGLVVSTASRSDDPEVLRSAVDVVVRQLRGERVKLKDSMLYSGLVASLEGRPELAEDLERLNAALQPSLNPADDTA